jgi:chorismate mutase
LEKLRSQINHFDDELIALIHTRMRVAEKIGELKRENNVTVLQTNRWGEILERMVKKSSQTNLSEEFIRSLMELLHVESIRIQNEGKVTTIS